MSEIYGKHMFDEDAKQWMGVVARDVGETTQVFATEFMPTEEEINQWATDKIREIATEEMQAKLLQFGADIIATLNQAGIKAPVPPYAGSLLLMVYPHEKWTVPPEPVGASINWDDEQGKWTYLQSAEVHPDEETAP